MHTPKTHAPVRRITNTPNKRRQFKLSHACMPILPRLSPTIPPVHNSAEQNDSISRGHTYEKQERGRIGRFAHGPRYNAVNDSLPRPSTFERSRIAVFEFRFCLRVPLRANCAKLRARGGDVDWSTYSYANCSALLCARARGERERVDRFRWRVFLTRKGLEVVTGDGSWGGMGRLLKNL